MFMKSSGLLGDLGFTLEMTVGSGTVWWKSSHRGGRVKNTCALSLKVILVGMLYME